MEDNTSTDAGTSSNDVAVTTADVQAAASPVADTISAPATAASGSSGAAAAAQVVADAAKAPVAYSPTYKYKVKDKEMEFDEFLRPAIKTAEQEAKARELYEKAMGLDEVKNHREEIRTKFKSYQEQTEPLVNTMKTAASFYNQADQALKTGNTALFVKNAEAFFSKIGVPQQVLQTYMHHYFKLQDLPPEQKQVYNQQWELTQQAQAQQSHISQAEQRANELQLQMHQMELSQTLQRPEISSLQQAYEQKFGQGAFMKAMQQRGEYAYLSSGGKTNLSPAQVATQILEEYRWLVQQPAAQAQAATSQAAPASQGQVPVIPVAKGGSASPVAKKPQTLEDLKKMYQEKFG